MPRATMPKPSPFRTTSLPSFAAATMRQSGAKYSSTLNPLPENQRVAPRALAGKLEIDFAPSQPPRLSPSHFAYCRDSRACAHRRVLLDSRMRGAE